MLKLLRAFLYTDTLGFEPRTDRLTADCSTVELCVKKILLGMTTRKEKNNHLKKVLRILSPSKVISI